MPLYRVPCFWQVGGYLEIEAEDEVEASELAHDAEQSLPDETFYVEGSFDVEYEQIQEVQ